jgi:transposase
MRALDDRVVEAVWQAVAALLPMRPEPEHPLGCHRQRIPDRECFVGILIRLVTGCSWDVAAKLCLPGETTLRNRRSEWVETGVFDALAEEAISAWDRIVGLDLCEVAIDGSQHKAPFGGEGTGPNPTDRGKCGWKWSIATDRRGIPIGWGIDGANRHDVILFQPTIDSVTARGLVCDIETLHLDRGYDCARIRQACEAAGIEDLICARKRSRGEGSEPKWVPLGMRWPVERTNSWLSNFGQLRRNTDRFTHQRLAEIALAIVLIITVKLFDYADRWSPR